MSGTVTLEFLAGQQARILDEIAALRELLSARVLWSDERERAFLALHAAGHSDTEIAATMGVSRSGVIGKRQRLGLKPNQGRRSGRPKGEGR